MALAFKFAGREYPMPDFTTITFREQRLIKKTTGLRMGELPEAFSAGDSDAILALFLIAKSRVDGASGVDLDTLENMPINDLEVVGDEGEEEAAETPLPEQPELPADSGEAAPDESETSTEP